MVDNYNALEQAINTGNITLGVTEAVKLAESGVTPSSIFQNCIVPYLKEIGDRFGRLEIFLPELMEAASVVKAVEEALKPYHKAKEVVHQARGRIVLCTTQGDLHDIGKNIVKAMLQVNGFDVYDLGVNVSPTEVIKAAKNYNADLIAISALMLTSLPYVRDTIEIVKNNDEYKSRFKIMVGGGPVSLEWAMKAQADGYGDDAMEAVKQAASLISGHTEKLGRG
jgi:methanogenic corrinoid protein MtbC1